MTRYRDFDCFNIIRLSSDLYRFLFIPIIHVSLVIDLALV